MVFKGKEVLVVGLAKSGVSAIKALFEVGASVTITDIKPIEKLNDLYLEVKPFVKEAVLGTHPTILDNFDFAVMSPGVPLDLPFVDQMRAAGVQIIGEIELAYQLSKGSYIGITGTNGKTTTTALTGAIFDLSGKKHFVVGNIGLPAVSKALETDADTTMVTEISSFQLETIVDFRAKIAAVLNLKPDHLNRHKTMEGYVEAKMRIFENQTAEDQLVLNYDDSLTRALNIHSKGKVHYFSRVSTEGQSAFIQERIIKLNCNGQIENVCPIEEMKIFGRHNEENALAAALICRLAGIPVEVIAKGLRSFSGVEHRIEFTAEINGVKYYNDSKGTNPDSTICAIDAMVRPTYLIAGGYDKNSDFSPVINVFEDKIKTLILLGATKDKIAMAAKQNGFNQIVFVENMEQAVAYAYEHAVDGDAVLLSPACASWDMYDNFEKRGEHFKTCVHQYLK
ncbi:UDP-N-acetylmuramoyl-L-alanine--D-glutamate ligase [Fusibacter bizertensis]